jgi:hypothetical protein
LLGALAVLVAAALGTFAVDAAAFGVHKEITEAGLSDPTAPRSFLREAILDDINEQHDFMDDDFPSGRGGQDQRHFDDCEFDGGADFIRDQYGFARRSLGRPVSAVGGPFYATLGFGRALHPAQDFYSHSNWVEIGFPLSDDPSTAEIEAAQSDLVDLSGAQASLGLAWYAPTGGGIVRRAASLGEPFGEWSILLGADDWFIPRDWEIEPNGRPSDPGGTVLHVPTLIDPQGRTQGKLLVTGEGSGDDECDVRSFGEVGFGELEYDGLEHNGNERGLNKDEPEGPRAALHAPARALATLQTSFEWCRMVRSAALGREPKDGLLLAMWVRAGANPHPLQTPCAKAPPGPISVVVTIESIQVLDARDSDDDDPGEIQIAAALYDSPFSFRRSVHVTNRSGRHMDLDDGDRVPTAQLPSPLRLCVGRGDGATFALHGWDNDDDTDDRFENAYDDKGDHDDLLLGVQQRLGRRPPIGVQTASSDYVRVRYRVTRSDAVTSPRCAVPRVAQAGRAR